MEVETTVQAVSTKPKSKLWEGARKNKKFVTAFILFSLIFLFLQIAYQFFILTPGDISSALLRGFAFTGATFFSIALSLSVFFKWNPKWGRFWYVRRSFGVMGFVFILGHVWTATSYLFQGNSGLAFWNLNPFQNPVVWGVAALPFFFILFITSTDWAFERIGPRKWKTIHRTVYLGYYFSVLHFLTINPPLLMNLAGYLLLIFTFLAVAGELYWFVAAVVRKQTSRKAIIIGVFLIVLWLLAIYLYVSGA